MSNYQRSGVPQTLNVEADATGLCVRLRQWSSSLYLQADAAATVYWTQEDFDADRNGVLLPGDQTLPPFQFNVAVANVWLRGRGATSKVSITAIGRDG